MAEILQSPHPTIENRYRVICFFKKRPDLTYEEFYNHWFNVHGPLVAPWFEKHGILRYTQIYTPSGVQGQWTNTSGIPTMPFDGLLELEFTDTAQMEAAFSDPFYLEHVLPDEHKFLDKSNGEYGSMERPMSTMGYVRHFVSDAKQVTYEKGTPALPE